MTAVDRPSTGHSAPAFGDADAETVRSAFPALSREVNGHPLVYLDSAATTQKPQVMLDAVTRHYERHNANVHRGVHTLSQEATQAFERARARVAAFVNAASPDEIVFTRGVTESVNLVANAWGRANLSHGDEIVVSRMEHHSNIVPWQMIAEATGATLRVAEIDERGDLRLDDFAAMLNGRTKVVALTHVSNTLGTINPVARVVELAHRAGAVVLLDGAQAAAHVPIDVRAIGCDFYTLSGHKSFGPTGIGALYARREVLDAMPPYQGGGEMIRSVSFEGTTYNDIPWRFEAGTPNIAGAVGFAAALDFIAGHDREAVAEYERSLLARLTSGVREIPGVRVLGEAAEKSPVLSFVIDGVHPHDLGTYLDTEGVAVRTGKHCTEPLMDFFGVPATVRASLALHNLPREVDHFVAALERGVQFFR